MIPIGLTRRRAINTRKALIIGCGIAGPAAAMSLRMAGIDAAIYEARGIPDDDGGAFLGVAPNGLDVLRTLGLEGRIADDGFVCPRMVMWNGSGKRIGEMFNGSPGPDGSAGIMIKRGSLNRALREEAARRGITVEFGKKLASIEADAGRSVVARFEDGSSAAGDFLIGCDGIRSRTRRAILPDGPGLSYTGLVGCGGFAHNAAIAPTPDALHFVLGKRAFFGYTVRPSGEIWWFNNIAFPGEPTRKDLQAIPRDEWRRKLLELHGDDPAPIPEIVRSIGDEMLILPVCDIPSLPTWHRGPAVLIGDAAHAASPHAGQGASMALEDAVVLAKCLRDIPCPEDAFARFEGLRRERVEMVARVARRNGQNKAMTNPVALWLRDLAMSIAFKLAARSKSDPWGFSHRIDWDARA